MSDHQELRAKFEADAQVLRERLRKIRGDLRQQNEPLSADFAEQAVELENSEVLAALEIKTQARLEYLETALQKMHDNTYGICVTCGDLIAEKRLDAIPEATRCLPCAQAAENAQ
jgi:RNA polymerase-binding transcription factor DksA